MQPPSSARLRLVALALAGLLAVVASAASASSTNSSTAPTISNSPSLAPKRIRDGALLVGFKRGVAAAERSTLIRRVGGSQVRTIGSGTHVVRVASGKVLAIAAALRRNAAVRYAEPDYAVRAELAPNDPSYNQLWGLRAIHADTAWNSTTGTAGVVVGVVDTGIDYTHPDLAANVWTSTGTINGCPAGTHGFNALNGTCNPMDDNHHGTHVSGTIGAVGNNGVGVIGVNSTTRIMGLKFLDATGQGWISGAISAIDWAVRAKTAGVNLRVLSNSWGNSEFSQALLDAINRAAANDILFVAAAGNYSSSNDTYGFYPCNYAAANVVCVAATDKNDSLARFSNYGASSVDLAAPGVAILSTVPGGYDSLSGTSMATPHVAGAAALALSTGYQSVATLKSTILRAVEPVASLAGRVETGGRLDVCKAIPACSGITPPPPPPPAPGGDFSLTVSDARQALRPGGTTTFTVTATPSGGFAGDIAFNLSGLPPGTSASFAPTPLGLAAASSTSQLSVSADPTPSPGNYTLAITGVSGTLAHSTEVVLQVRRK